MAKQEQLPVAEARTGDAGAWDVLFRRHQLPLYAYVQEMVRNEQVSLDIVQEAFIKAVRHIHTLRDDRRFSGWLFRIAHQLCQNHWRRLRPEEPIEDQGEVDSSDTLPNPSEELVASEQKELFHRAVEALPEEHRSVFLLHCLEEFQLDEIAEITGVPLGTVKSRLFHARKKLRQLLSPEFKS